MSASPIVRVVSEGIRIEGLSVTDPAVTDYLLAHPPDLWGGLLGDMLSVGARGLLSMGVGATMAEIDDRLRSTMDDVLEGASGEVELLLAGAHAAIKDQLDPEVRSSAMGVTLDRLAEIQASMTKALDVDHATSVTSTLLARLNGLVGPQGAMEQWVRNQFDQTNPDSPLAVLGAAVEQRFAELREMILRDQIGRTTVAKTTLKGFAYEDTVEDRLRTIAAGLGGAFVERTSLMGGRLRSDSKVGDFVIELEDGSRVVVEAKNTDSIAVGGKDGILSQLDRAMVNRGADAAICVSAVDAFPSEVGSFAVHGKRVLCVDDGSGVLLGVAIRILRAMLAAEATNAGLDLVAVNDRILRIRALATRFSGAKSTLTKVTGSIADVQGLLDDIRSDLLDHTSELGATLARAPEDRLSSGPSLLSA